MADDHTLIREALRRFTVTDHQAEAALDRLVRERDEARKGLREARPYVEWFATGDEVDPFDLAQAQSALGIVDAALAVPVAPEGEA